MSEPIRSISGDSVGRDAPRRAEYNKVGLGNRCTYTPTNAEAFRGLFDEMITTGLNKEIHSGVVRLKPSSLYVKAQDALKWLAECHPTEKDKYALLKSRVSMRKLPEGLLIYYKMSISNIIQKGSNSVSLGKEWKDEITAWLEKAQSGELFERTDILVDDPDKMWLVRLLAGIEGVEIEFTTSGFRVMR